MKNKTMIVAVLVLLSANLRADPVVHPWRVHADDPDNILTNDVHVTTPLSEIPACDRIQVLNESADMTVRLRGGGKLPVDPGGVFSGELRQSADS